MAAKFKITKALRRTFERMASRFRRDGDYAELHDDGVDLYVLTRRGENEGTALLDRIENDYGAATLGSGLIDDGDDADENWEVVAVRWRMADRRIRKDTGASEHTTSGGLNVNDSISDACNFVEQLAGAGRMFRSADKRISESTKGAYPFADREEQYAKYTDAQLRFAVKDASAAADAMKKHDPAAEAWYIDDMHTILKEINSRKHNKRKAEWAGGSNLNEASDSPPSFNDARRAAAAVMKTVKIPKNAVAKDQDAVAKIIAKAIVGDDMLIRYFASQASVFPSKPDSLGYVHGRVILSIIGDAISAHYPRSKPYHKYNPDKLDPGEWQLPRNDQGEAMWEYLPTHAIIKKAIRDAVRRHPDLISSNAPHRQAWRSESVPSFDRLMEADGGASDTPSALSKMLKKLKKDVGATKIRQGYRGTGRQAHRRQIWIDLASGPDFDAFIESDRITLGGVMSPFGRPAPFIKYGNRDVAAIYADIVRFIKAAQAQRAQKHESSDGKWIQKAIKHPGALRAAITQRTKDGNIPVPALKKAAQMPGVMGRRGRLAMTLRKLGKGHK